MQPYGSHVAGRMRRTRSGAALRLTMVIASAGLGMGLVLGSMTLVIDAGGGNTPPTPPVTIPPGAQHVGRVATDAPSLAEVLGPAKNDDIRTLYVVVSELSTNDTQPGHFPGA